jgi:hypothetical protein
MKISLRSLAATLAIAAPLAAIAQQTTRQLNPNEVATNIVGIASVAAPPKGFDPIAASDQELAYYGFPPRPDAVAAPKVFESWRKAMSAPKTRIVPALETTGIYHGPARLKAESAQNGVLKSYNWSGYVNTNGVKKYSASSFSAVNANFVVPIAHPAFGTCSGMPVYGANWVGIDGDGSSDVLQAGVEFDALCAAGENSTLYAGWFEWYPNAETRITNLKAAAGDDIYIEVYDTSATSGHAYLANLSRNIEVSVNFTAPSGTVLVGNSAEWIVERPEVNGSLATLPNYVEDIFWDSFALNPAYDVVDPSSTSSSEVLMLDNQGNYISYPTLLGRGAFVMQDEGSVF